MTDSLCDGDPLARQLAVLQPAPAALSRESLMFAAGVASRESRLRFWRWVAVIQAAVLMLVTVTAGAYVLEGHYLRESPPFSDQTPRPGLPSPTVKPINPAPYDPGLLALTPKPTESKLDAQAEALRLHADILTYGLDALPNRETQPVWEDPGQVEKALQLPRGILAINPGKKDSPKEKVKDPE